MEVTLQQPVNGSELKCGLKQRHMTMIALGGVIGAGLFVGSGVVIRQAGPAAIISFLLTGGLVVLVMRMLGEMASAMPAVGSFYEYARLAFGERRKSGELAGFLTGWMYWYFWVIVVAVETVAGAHLVQFWLPEVPAWMIGLVLLVTLTLTNLVSVGSYGEFEFWFASVKVAAIMVFLFVGTLFVLGMWPSVDHAALPIASIAAHGGFMPNGIGPVLTGAVAATGFYFGAEIVTIAAAEAHEPESAVAKATNSVITRVLVFLCGIDSAGRRDRAVEFAGDGDAVCQRARSHADSGGGASDERDHFDGGAVGAELGALCGFADDVCADASWRCAACAGEGQQRGVPVRAILIGHVVRLCIGGDVVCFAGYGVCLPRQFLRDGGDLRLSADRHVAIEAACAARTRSAGEAAREDVVLSVPDLGRDRGDGLHHCGDGVHSGSEEAVVVRGCESCGAAGRVLAAEPLAQGGR